MQYLIQKGMRTIKRQFIVWARWKYMVVSASAYCEKARVLKERQKKIENKEQTWNQELVCHMKVYCGLARKTPKR